MCLLRALFVRVANALCKEVEHIRIVLRLLLFKCVCVGCCVCALLCWVGYIVVPCMYVWSSTHTVLFVCVVVVCYCCC